MRDPSHTNDHFSQFFGRILFYFFTIYVRLDRSELRLLGILFFLNSRFYK